MKSWLRRARSVQGKNLHLSGAGYTMTEVMIVLIVSSALFIAIAIGFQGRHARVEFTQAVRNYEAKIQNVMSDVAKGSYSVGSGCNAGNNGPPGPSGSAPLGTNDTCIFLGKIISSDTNESDILTVVGRRLEGGTGSADVSELDDAEPTVFSNATETMAHTFGLEVRRVVRLSGAMTANIATFGFLNQLAGSAPASGGGGSSSILLYGVPGTTPSAATTDMSSLILLPEGLLICLRGSNGQRAEVRIGENNSQTSITSVLDTANAGACLE